MTTTTTIDRVGAPPRRSLHRAAPVVAWAAVLIVARVVGLRYVAADDRPLSVDAVPWVGQWGFESALLARLCVAAVVGATCLWLLPAAVQTARWRWVLLASAAATVAFSLALVWAGPSWTHWHSIELGYGQHIEMVDGPGPADYLHDYVERQPHLPGHLRAHPPGLVLALWAAEHIGLRGTGFQLVLVLACSAVASVAALVAAREVGGSGFARAAAPFVAIAPAAVWHTNPDVVFGAVGIVGIALVVVATGRPGTVRDAFAVAGGIVFAAALMCSYGVVLLAVPAVTVGLYRRAGRALLVAGLGCVGGLLVAAIWGFWWPAGLLETRVQYRHSLAATRGYAYWLLGNAATYLALVGPATVAGLSRLRKGGARVLVLSGVACAVLAGLSGMSSAETERIWQPFAPLALLAAAALWWQEGRFDLRAARVWLAVQAGVALTFQALLQSPW